MKIVQKPKQVPQLNPNQPRNPPHPTVHPVTESINKTLATTSTEDMINLLRSMKVLNINPLIYYLFTMILFLENISHLLEP